MQALPLKLVQVSCGQLLKISLSRSDYIDTAKYTSTLSDMMLNKKRIVHWFLKVLSVSGKVRLALIAKLLAQDICLIAGTLRSIIRLNAKIRSLTFFSYRRRQRNHFAAKTRKINAERRAIIKLPMKPLSRQKKFTALTHCACQRGWHEGVNGCSRIVPSLPSRACILFTIQDGVAAVPSLACWLRRFIPQADLTVRFWWSLKEPLA